MAVEAGRHFKRSLPHWDPGKEQGAERLKQAGTLMPAPTPWASLGTQLVKNPPAVQETRVQPLGWEDPLEEGKATHSSILAWRTPWTVRSMGSQRVGHDRAPFTSVPR